ncbi:MAG TPA: ATP-binding protein, partial [Gemmatimonadaceae bacterium]
EYQEIIFRKFERVRAANAPRVRSSGLGLTFCRLAVESHGGRIWVKSTEGEGSTFYVQLPLAPVEPARTLHRTGEFASPAATSAAPNRT